MDRWVRAAFNNCYQGPALFIVKLTLLTWGFAVDQAISPPGIKPFDPVSYNLQTNATDPSRITAPTAIIYLRQR